MKKWRSSWEDKGKIRMSFQHLDQKVRFYGGDICGSVCWHSNRCQSVLGCNDSSSSNYYSRTNHQDNVNNNNNNASSQWLLLLLLPRYLLCYINTATFHMFGPLPDHDTPSQFNNKSNWSKVGGTTAVGTWGYLLAMEELNEQLLGSYILLGSDWWGCVCQKFKSSTIGRVGPRWNESIPLGWGFWDEFVILKHFQHTP